MNDLRYTTVLTLRPYIMMMNPIECCLKFLHANLTAIKYLFLSTESCISWKQSKVDKAWLVVLINGQAQM